MCSSRLPRDALRAIACPCPPRLVQKLDFSPGCSKSTPPGQSAGDSPAGFSALVPRVCIPASWKRSYANSPGYTVAVYTACADDTAPRWAKPSRQLLGVDLRPARDTSFGYWRPLQGLGGPQTHTRRCILCRVACVCFRKRGTSETCRLRRRAARSFRAVAPCTRSFWRTHCRPTGGAVGSPSIRSPDLPGFLSSRPLRPFRPVFRGGSLPVAWIACGGGP